MKQVAEEVGGFFVYNLYNSCPIGELAASKFGMNRALERRRDVHQVRLSPAFSLAQVGNFLWLS